MKLKMFLTRYKIFRNVKERPGLLEDELFGVGKTLISRMEEEGIIYKENGRFFPGKDPIQLVDWLDSRTAMMIMLLPEDIRKEVEKVLINSNYTERMKISTYRVYRGSAYTSLSLPIECGFVNLYIDRNKEVGAIVFLEEKQRDSRKIKNYCLSFMSLERALNVKDDYVYGIFDPLNKVLYISPRKEKLDLRKLAYEDMNKIHKYKVPFIASWERGRLVLNPSIFRKLKGKVNILSGRESLIITPSEEGKYTVYRNRSGIFIFCSEQRPKGIYRCTSYKIKGKSIILKFKPIPEVKELRPLLKDNENVDRHESWCVYCFRVFEWTPEGWVEVKRDDLIPEVICHVMRRRDTFDRMCLLCKLKITREEIKSLSSNQY